MKKYAPVTISLRDDVLAMCDVRAALFQLSRSRYLSSLIERDYRSGEKRIVIVAQESPKEKDQ